MSRNASGTFSLVAGNPVSGGTTISSTWANNTLSDIAAGLTQSVSKDGQTTWTGNMAAGGYKITNLGNGSAATDSATLGQVQAGAVTQLGGVGGTVDAITAASSPAILAYAAGQTFRFVSTGANTDAVTINISGLGVRNVTKNGTTPLMAADIPSGAVVEIVYDGTQFQLMGAERSDAAIAAYNAADPTKRARFSLTNLTTATTRVISVPDANITLTDRALTQQFATASGTNAYTANFGPVPAAYISGGFYLIHFTNANTISGCTLDIDSIGNASIVRQGGAALFVGDITANMYALLQYNGTQFVLLNPAVPAPLRYVSANQTISSAGTLTLAHGLPGTPIRLWYGLVNTSNEYGWSGEVLIQAFAPQDNSAAVARGATAYADATNVYVQYGSATAVFNVHQRTGTPGLTSAATNTNWRLRVYAEL